LKSGEGYKVRLFLTEVHRVFHREAQKISEIFVLISVYLCEKNANSVTSFKTLPSNGKISNSGFRIPGSGFRVPGLKEPTLNKYHNE
jgi:hypothetical protein